MDKLGREILVPALAEAFGHDLSAQFDKGSFEKLGQSHTIILGFIGQHRGPAGLKILEGKSGRRLALKGIQEAHPKDVTFPLGDQGVGGRGRDHGDPGFLGEGSAGQGVAADGLADNGRNLVLFDQPADRVGRFNLVALGIDQKQFDFFAQDLGFHSLGRLDPGPFHLPERGHSPGHGQIDADLHRFLGQDGKRYSQRTPKVQIRRIHFVLTMPHAPRSKVANFFHRKPGASVLTSLDMPMTIPEHFAQILCTTSGQSSRLAMLAPSSPVSEIATRIGVRSNRELFPQLIDQVPLIREMDLLRIIDKEDERWAVSLRPGSRKKS